MKKLYHNLLFIFLMFFIVVKKVFAQTGGVAEVEYVMNTSGLGEVDPRDMAHRIINIVSTFLLFITLLISIWSGVLWLRAGKNGKETKKRKKVVLISLFLSVVVLVLTLLAYFVVYKYFDTRLGITTV